MLGTLDFTCSEHWAPCSFFLEHSLENNEIFVLPLLSSFVFFFYIYI